MTETIWRVSRRVLLLMSPVLLAACSGVRWPWGGGGCDCQSAPRMQGPSAVAPPSGPPPVPPPMEPEPLADGGEAAGVDAPPPPEPGAAPPRATLPPMPDGPRAAWSAAADPDIAALPPETAVEPARPWTVIVVHHSATARGGAALFDKMHKERGWDGVGYHFVIGNGTDTGDGAVEVTFRWREQRDGAHAKGWNDVGIGICLVGNFENTDPTAQQTASLVRLLRHLRRRFGIPAERVVGHKALNPTLCPGKRFDLAAFVAASAP